MRRLSRSRARGYRPVPRGLRGRRRANRLRSRRRPPRRPRTSETGRPARGSRRPARRRPRSPSASGPSRRRPRHPPGPGDVRDREPRHVPHGFEIEREDRDDDAGKVETRVLQPGESVEVEARPRSGRLQARVATSTPRRHGHGDARGAPRRRRSEGGDAERGRDRGFAFSPATVTVQVGQPVAWENDDPADHSHSRERRLLRLGTMDAGAASRPPSTGRAVPVHLRAPPGDDRGGGRGVEFDRAPAVGQTVG